MTRRKVSDDERKEFEQDFREAKPIKVAAAKGPAKKKSTSLQPTGVNGATEDRLRRGMLEPDAKLDLHGMTEAAAYRALSRFLVGAQQRGNRLILVVTGKGNPRKEESASWMVSPHGVLKQMVPRWLKEPELAPMIASTKAAHVRHGGDGALYVYLRKSQ
ncbi:MAG: Smr/MutS family protein [Pseudomonadota bacterium]